MSRPIDRELVSWTAKADQAISRRLADARAHAHAGRMQAARDRLGELGVALERLIERARVMFLRRSAGRKGLAFGPDSDDVARSHPILKRTPADIRRFVQEAFQSLAGAAHVAEGVPSGPREVIFKGWEARQADIFSAQVKGHLSDAQMSMANVVELMAREEKERDDEEVDENDGVGGRRLSDGRNPDPGDSVDDVEFGLVSGSSAKAGSEAEAQPEPEAPWRTPETVSGPEFRPGSEAGGPAEAGPLT